MTVTYNLSKQYLDIIPELKASVEALMLNTSSEIKSKGLKMLKAIQE
jgi:hypothetical protein